MSIIGDLFILGVIKLFGNTEQKENLGNSLCELAKREAEFNEIAGRFDRSFLKTLSEELMVIPEKSQRKNSPDPREFDIYGFSNN